MFRNSFIATLIYYFPFLSLVYASIYPTQPVQGTVWTAGQSMLVMWAEDGLYPTVNVMGPVSVELWENSNTYTGTLVTNVDPKTGAVQVTVPSQGIHDQSNYTLHFVMHAPLEATVYSADFKITSTAKPAALAGNPNPPPSPAGNPAQSSPTLMIPGINAIQLGMGPMNPDGPPFRPLPIVPLTASSTATVNASSVVSSVTSVNGTAAMSSTTYPHSSDSSGHPQQTGKSAASRRVDYFVSNKYILILFAFVWAKLN